MVERGWVVGLGSWATVSIPLLVYLFSLHHLIRPPTIPLSKRSKLLTGFFLKIDNSGRARIHGWIPMDTLDHRDDDRPKIRSP